MRLLLCSVLDKKVGTYASPFSVRSTGEAIRSFMDACNDSSLPFLKHPEDYCLYHIAEYDDQTALITPNQYPEPLLEAVNVPREKQP